MHSYAVWTIVHRSSCLIRRSPREGRSSAGCSRRTPFPESATLPSGRLKGAVGFAVGKVTPTSFVAVLGLLYSRLPTPSSTLLPLPNTPSGPPCSLPGTSSTPP